VADSCKPGNEFSGSIKGGEFFDYVSVLQVLKETCAPWS
jgi:hypothetical protein